MVFKFATFDPAQDPDDFNPAFPPTPSSSPSATLCQPFEYTCTFTRAIVSRLAAAGASIVLKAPAVKVDGREIRDRSAETPFYSINFDVHPEFLQRQLKEFTLKELQVATQNFSIKKLIARGGFGNVYEGQLADGSLVAIKRLHRGCNHGISEIEREVMIGSIIPQGQHLLPLLGFCRTSQGADFLLVSPLMINNSVSCCLRERRETRVTRPLLDWLTRRKIALGAARGLSRLHDLNIVHLDIKPANILLDEEFEPHIADFGLARFINRRRGHGVYLVDGTEDAPVLPRNELESRSQNEDSYSWSSIRGTIGYMAPEYVRAKYSVKNDIFAFGITLLELMTGQRPYKPITLANDRYVTLVDWAKAHLVEGSWEIIVDPDLQGEYEPEETEKTIQLALLCTQTDPRRRPSMWQVARILEGYSIEDRWEEYRRSEEYLIPSMQTTTPYSEECLIPSMQPSIPCWSLPSPEELSAPR
ncbi:BRASSINOSTEROID INSENSITIVE 1-associated receptor kinase 1-like [Rhodamnia argentea]|uniref:BRASSINOSTEROID INSENSITIVE 1-associated receptor kinase 1-like n=1 Tax=Rhodamnia argentea TaxID=178133 RepID=A0A8B8N274_9MYRT|nr:BRASSINOSTEROID INSENSITIVE 1-associated receptor kinase 1-like [Rhodamnia argentea]